MRTFITIALSYVMLHTAAQQSTDSTITGVSVNTYPLLQTAMSKHGDVVERINSLHFNEAHNLIESKQKAAKKLRKEVDRKAATAGLDELAERCTEGLNALNGTDRVLIVDSVVIDKAHFLDAYGITPDLGTLTMSDNGETVSYKAQLNGMELTVGGSPLQIMRHYSDDATDIPQPVPGLDIDGDVNYPFLLSDGQRFYFAARSEDGHCNYDLYATRYDNDTKRFYRAENMGYPYNSYANDYMLVIDEVNGLGWFASDRYQPEGHVCVYTFIPHDSRHTFDDSKTTESQLICAASLRSIKQLQKLYTKDEMAQIANARNTIASLSMASQKTQHNDFEFVINDATTYHSINDFKSAKARQLCKQWQQCVNNIASLRRNLDDMRTDATHNAAKILENEKRINLLNIDINELAKMIRSEEIFAK